MSDADTFSKVDLQEKLVTIIEKKWNYFVAANAAFFSVLILHLWSAEVNGEKTD